MLLVGVVHPHAHRLEVVFQRSPGGAARPYRALGHDEDHTGPPRAALDGQVRGVGVDQRDGGVPARCRPPASRSRARDLQLTLAPDLDIVLILRNTSVDDDRVLSRAAASGRPRPRREGAIGRNPADLLKCGRFRSHRGGCGSALLNRQPSAAATPGTFRASASIWPMRCHAGGRPARHSRRSRTCR